MNYERPNFTRKHFYMWVGVTVHEYIRLIQLQTVVYGDISITSLCYFYAKFIGVEESICERRTSDNVTTHLIYTFDSFKNIFNNGQEK